MPSGDQSGWPPAFSFQGVRRCKPLRSGDIWRCVNFAAYIKCFQGADILPEVILSNGPRMTVTSLKAPRITLNIVISKWKREVGDDGLPTGIRALSDAVLAEQGHVGTTD